LRLLFVHDRIGWFGGVEQNVFDSAGALRERGHTCLLAHGPEARNPADWARAFDRSFPAAELYPEGAPDDARPLARLIEDLAPDLLYLHKVPVAALGPWPVRTVRMVHDHDLTCPRRHKYFLWNGRICDHPAGWRCWLDGAFLVRRRGGGLPLGFEGIGPKLRHMRRNWELDALLVGSRAMRAELLMNGAPAERVHVVPPAVRWTAPEAVTPPAREPVILYVGQLIRGKGVDLLLEAAAGLERPWRLLLAGDGNARPALEAQARDLGIADRVEFLGFVPHERLGGLYARCRVAAVPSRWPEPFGMVGVEAMAHARPVAAFAAGGIPDWCAHGETGLLAPPGDIAALRDALDRLLGDELLAHRLGQAGRERALREFRFDRLVDRLETFLQQRQAA